MDLCIHYHNCSKPNHFSSIIQTFLFSLFLCHWSDWAHLTIIHLILIYIFLSQWGRAVWISTRMLRWSALRAANRMWHFSEWYYMIKQRWLRDERNLSVQTTLSSNKTPIILSHGHTPWNEMAVPGLRQCSWRLDVIHGCNLSMRREVKWRVGRLGRWRGFGLPSLPCRGAEGTSTPHTAIFHPN